MSTVGGSVPVARGVEWVSITAPEAAVDAMSVRVGIVTGPLTEIKAQQKRQTCPEAVKLLPSAPLFQRDPSPVQWRYHTATYGYHIWTFNTRFYSQWRYHTATKIPGKHAVTLCLQMDVRRLGILHARALNYQAPISAVYVHI